MAGKKKKSTKSKKKKSTAASAGSEVADGEVVAADAGAPSSAGKKKGGKKKKGSKKSKLSLGEKLLVKLEKGVDLLKANKFQYEHFVQIADTWLLQHGKKLKHLLLQMDDNRDAVVGYDEMKSALYDIDCPMNMVEMHLLCKLLDSENSGDIEYFELGEGLRHYMKLAINDEEHELGGSSDEEEEEKFTLTRGQSARDIKHCTCCKVGLWLPVDPDIQYAEVTMMLITFADTLKKHPCHFTITLHTHLTIYGLIQLIKSEVGVQSTTISVFRDKTRSEGSELQPHLTLADCGYDGREWYNPMEHVIYYDYTSEFNDCPILMCDHYFTDRLKLS